MMAEMDKFFNRIGLDEQDIKTCSTRGLLYIGIIFMAGMMTAFLVMAVLG